MSGVGLYTYILQLSNFLFYYYSYMSYIIQTTQAVLLNFLRNGNMSASTVRFRKFVIMGIFERFVVFNAVLPIWVHASVLAVPLGLFATKTTYDNSYNGDKTC